MEEERKRVLKLNQKNRFQAIDLLLLVPTLSRMVDILICMYLIMQCSGVFGSQMLLSLSHQEFEFGGF